MYTLHGGGGGGGEGEGSEDFNCKHSLQYCTPNSIVGSINDAYNFFFFLQSSVTTNSD